MKLVINSCYGGFGLSPKAYARLAELRGQKCYFFVGGRGGTPLKQVPMEEAKGLMWCACNTPTPTLSPTSLEWAEMSGEERRASNKKYQDERVSSSAENRSDPLLVQVVEELGAEASGDCAFLKVIEIPDGTDFEIQEYDGNESVHETHRSWN